MIDELPEDWCKVLLKLETKWRISTPKGWSMLLVDPTFQFNDCIQAVLCVLNTDYWHESNMFFCKETRCAVCYGVWSTFDYTHSNTKKKITA